MIWVADEAMILEINHEVKKFKGNLTDQNRTILGHFHDVNNTFTILNRQPDRVEALHDCTAVRRPDPPASGWSKSKLID